MKINWFY